MLTKDVIKLVTKDMDAIGFNGSKYHMSKGAYANKYEGKPKRAVLIEHVRSVLSLSNMLECAKKPDPELITRMEKYVFVVHNAVESRLDYLNARDDLRIQEIYRKY